MILVSARIVHERMLMENGEPVGKGGCLWICLNAKALPSRNLKRTLREKFSGMPRTKPGAAGCKVRMPSIVLCSPTSHLMFLDAGAESIFMCFTSCSVLRDRA